jgi:hypothetical protein
MARTSIIAAGAGVLSALLFLTVAVGSLGAMIFCYLAPLPLFAMGLGAGLISAATAGATATALVGLIAGVIPAASFVVLFVTPVVVLVRYALMSRIAANGRLEWYPPGRLVMWLVGIGAVTFFAGILLISGGRTVEERLKSVLSPALAQYAQGVGQDQLQSVIDFFARLPSIMVVVWLLVIAAAGILAQGLLGGFGRALRPSPPIAAIELPRSAGIVTVLAFAANVFETGWLEFAGRNLLLLLALAFFFAGLGVVHGLVRGTYRLLVLIAFYFSMIPFLMVIPPVVAAIGFVDHWVHFRRRFPGSSEGGA